MDDDFFLSSGGAGQALQQGGERNVREYYPFVMITLLPPTRSASGVK